ncbi:hypothetical protein D9Q98_010285 [Chlorella vulgaris]|uniref:Uncharacterized protein n=1 Tax=Chlorella vulgaris TaxID=3077 RepID=A0A9D4YUU6_CHLVU|nr:hypothetical protein D9Q98_010285 [Chlorella vulgaris]
MGPMQSVHESILKSPTPTRRSKAAASTAGVAPRALMAAGGGGAAAAAAAAVVVAAAAAEQGAVDQPAPHQQQHQHQQQQEAPHQPTQQHQQQGQPEAAAARGFAAAEPAAAAAAVLPDVSEPEAAAGVDAEAEATLGCTGSSPVTTPPAKRQRTLTDQQPQQQQKLQQPQQQTQQQQQAQQQQAQQQQGQQPGSAERSASHAVQAAAAAAGVSPRRHSPRQKAAPGASQVTALPAARPPRPSLPSTPSAAAAAAATSGSPGASTAAAPGLGAGAASAPAWWDLLDASKVREVKAALHVGSYATGSIPVCREREAAAVGGWLQRQLAQRQGGSIYLSGLPGTGTSCCVALHCISSCKSLTAHEVVRQCWRPAPPSPSACAGEGPCGGGGAAAAAVLVPAPPPALLSINCMSITDPHQVAERILLGYAQACAAPHPEAVAAAGQDTIVYPTAAEAGGGGVAASRRKSDGDLLKQLRHLSQAPMPPAAVPVTAAAPAAASPPAKAKAKARRGTKRKSSTGGRGGAAAAAEAAALVSDGCASAGCARGMLVVVLDELDALLSGSKGEKVMENLFAMAAADGSRLLLLGIANSVDLVQRLMRPGGALHRRNLKPAHEIFATYLSRQFSQVLHQRLGALPGQVFDGKAIELCSRKMANGSGDMRWALEACSQALELAVKEAAAAAATAASEVAAVQAAAADRPAGAAAASSGPPPSRLVGLRHMAAALSRITGGIGLSNTNVQAIRALPPQQKLLVCTAGKLLGDSLGSRGLTVLKPSHMPTPGGSRKAGGTSAAAGRAKVTFMSPANSAASSIKSAASLASGAASGVVRSREVLLWQLEKAFSDLCKQVGMDPYDSLEFGTACEALQDRGLLGLSAARDPKWRRVTLQGSLRLDSSSRWACACSAVGSNDGDPILPKRRRAPPKSEAPAYDSQQLLHSLGLNGLPAELRRSISKMYGIRQRGLLQHAVTVVAHLRGLGLEQHFLEELFVRCPEMFSWPPKERAKGLFSELMSSGLTAAEAARCFVAFPQAARCISFGGSIAVVDEILSHSQDSNRGVKPKAPAAERTAAAMLRAGPNSVQILRLDATKLRHQCDRLVTLSCSLAAVAKLLWKSPALFASADSVAQLEQAAEVLHDELGLAPETVLKLAASNAPSWMTSSQDTLRRRAAALAEEFGRDEAASIVVRNVMALICEPSVWQRNKLYMAACGVGNARAVLLKSPRLLPLDHASPDFVARRLLLQRFTGLSAAQLYQQHAQHLIQIRLEQLALRLQYVEHRQSSLDDSQQQARGVAWPWPLRQLTYNLEHKTHNPGFLAALGSSQQEWDVFAAAHPAGSGPVWEWAQQEAGLEVQRLVGVLPPELQQAVRPQYKRRRAGTSLL